MQLSYIRKTHIDKPELLGMLQLFYLICQIMCCILILYFCWYVEAFGNWALLVNGSFLIMCGCIVAIWFIEGKIQFSGIPYGIWNHLIMVLYCVLTGIFVAFDKSALVYSIRQYIIYFFVMYAICIVSKHTGSYKWFLTMINIAALICCVHLIGWGHRFQTNRFVLSANSNPNILGLILNLGLFAILIRTTIDFKSLAFFLPQVCLILYNIVMTGSRKNFIVSITLVIIWCYSVCVQITREKNINNKIITFFIILCAGIALWYFYNTFVVNTTVFSRLQTMSNEESNGVRIEMYKEAYAIFLDKPIFGGGLEQYQYWAGRECYSHSTYAEAIADFGIIGTVLYFIPYLYVVIKAFKLAFIHPKSFICRFVFGFCLTEIFLGIGQIWFLEISHFYAWTMIFLIVQSISSDHKNISEIGRGYKYVRY